MSRQLRNECEGAFYHITFRGNERRKIYFSNYDYESLKNILKVHMGGMNYSAVSKVFQRYRTKLKGYRSLRKIMKTIENQMSHVEARPCFPPHNIPAIIPDTYYKLTPGPDNNKSLTPGPLFFMVVPQFIHYFQGISLCSDILKKSCCPSLSFSSRHYSDVP